MLRIIQNLVLQGKAHGAQKPRQYSVYGEELSTAQRGIVHER